VSKLRINDGLSLSVVVFQAFFLSYGLGCLTVLNTDEVRQCVIVNVDSSCVHCVQKKRERNNSMSFATSANLKLRLNDTTSCQIG